MPSLSKRVWLGVLAAVISVLIFHQGMWGTLHYMQLTGLHMPPPFPTDPIPPFGIPRIVNLCFWGGCYGAVFALVWRGPRGSYWLAGLALGIIAALIGLFLVPAIKGLPVGGGWLAANWTRSFLINGAWGLGLGVLLANMLGITDEEI